MAYRIQVARQSRGYFRLFPGNLYIRLESLQASKNKQAVIKIADSVFEYKTEASGIDSDPAKYVQKQELSSQLLKELSQLPLQEAQVFCLRHLNDMSYRQIAKELGIKTNAVGVLLFRAKENLRKSLDVSQIVQKSEVTL